MTPINRIPKV